MEWLWVLITLARQVSPAPDDQWATRLAALDTVRHRAFAEAAPHLLDQVYSTGSEELADDAATIRAYSRRDGRVVGAELRILSCRVIAASRDQTRLEVVDVLKSSQVVWQDGTTTDLPRDRPSQRIVTMERTADGWRISAVRDAER